MRTPVKAQLIAEGTSTLKRTSRGFAPMSQTASTRSRSTLRTPASVLKNTMNSTVIAASTIFMKMPMPNHTTNSGARATFGTL